MDILYIVGKGRSDCDNIELRMSLRSIEKHGKNITRVFVVGYCPEWLSDEVIKVPVDDIIKGDNLSCVEKHINITNCLLKAIDTTDIGPHFLVSMDDHFYLRDVDFDKYPFYVRNNSWGDNLPTMEWTFGDEYYEFLSETRDFLESIGLSTLCTTIHKNMHCDRSWIKGCREYLERVIKEKIPCEPWVLLNNYNHTKNGVEYTPIKDIKVFSVKDYHSINEKFTDCFSTNNFQKNGIIATLLKRMYSEKCKYEL